MSDVFLERTGFTTLYDRIASVLVSINLQEQVTSKKSILIKPNLVVASPASTGMTTDPRVIAAIVKWLAKDASVDKKHIIIGEGGVTGTTDKAFKVNGIGETAAELGVKLVNLNKDERVEVEVSDPLSLEKASLARTAVEADFIISVPSLKIHSMAITTLSLKNMMGAILPKGVMHTELNKRIADLCSVLKPDLAVIDGIIGGEVDEVSGNPVEMNTIIISTDPVAADAVGSAVMSVDPGRLDYLKYASQKGLGKGDLLDVNVIGQRIEDVRKRFKT
ncbi:MAG: DUF362 domain-containing protein [Candidatus Hodarchaeales archaeon]